MSRAFFVWNVSLLCGFKNALNTPQLTISQTWESAGLTRCIRLQATAEPAKRSRGAQGILKPEQFVRTVAFTRHQSDESSASAIATELKTWAAFESKPFETHRHSAARATALCKFGTPRARTLKNSAFTLIYQKIAPNCVLIPGVSDKRFRNTWTHPGDDLGGETR